VTWTVRGSSGLGRIQTISNRARIRYDPYRFSLLIDLDAIAARNCAMHDDFAGVIVANVLEAD